MVLYVLGPLLVYKPPSLLFPLSLLLSLSDSFSFSLILFLPSFFPPFLLIFHLGISVNLVFKTPPLCFLNFVLHFPQMSHWHMVIFVALEVLGGGVLIPTNYTNEELRKSLSFSRTAWMFPVLYCFISFSSLSLVLHLSHSLETMLVKMHTDASITLCLFRVTSVISKPPSTQGLKVLILFF